MRLVVLDTETTGLEVDQGHRIIEIGCVEIIGRRLTGRHYHQYINPEREIDAGAIEVHGITNEFLADKPVFSHVLEPFLSFIRGAELIIHNAPFDCGFINIEVSNASGEAFRVADLCKVTDTLLMARERHPGQRNSLDALCKRYEVDNTQRTLHGALLDAEILADLYLTMTGGQVSLLPGSGQGSGPGAWNIDRSRRVADASVVARLNVHPASAAECEAHRARMAVIQKKAGQIVWDA
jgi:DNA polymerase-3 subunit epsilon